MLLTRRPLATKFATLGTFITLCVVGLFLYQPDKWTPKFGTHQVPDQLIPRKIWYKLGPKGLTDQVKEWTDSCIKSNPWYDFEFLTDSSGDSYVKEKFADRPDIVDTYLSLVVPILKADLLRYLILYAEGGIWSDLDVSCGGIPIDEWVPTQYKQNASLVLGWEFDIGWDFAFVRQFASWTMMAKPCSPHIMVVVEDILEGLHNKAKESKVSLDNLTKEMAGEIVDMTGPRRLTRSVFKSLEATFDMKIDHDSISKLTQPKLVGDLLVLPGYSFAASSNTYDREEDKGPPLVTHHYAGTWKNEFGGEQT